MLTFNFKDKTYQLPLLKGEGNNWIELEEDEFNIELIFAVPPTLISSIFNETCLIQTDEDPIIILNLEIIYSVYNFDSKGLDPIGNLKLNPTLKDIENLELSKKINQESILYFPGYARRAHIESISFGEIIDDEINLKFSGTCVDINGELTFEVNHIRIPTK